MLIVDHTKRSKIVAIRHIFWTQKLPKLLLLPGLCSPGPHWGSLQRSPDPVVTFKGRFALGREKGREKGRGKEEKAGREGQGPPKSALDLPVRGNLLHRF